MSLRTRLLLLQIAVTAVFLLIMGIVSTALFAQHLRSQFNATVLAESTRSPSDIIRRPARGVAAVEATFGPFTVQPLNPDRPLAVVTSPLDHPAGTRHGSPPRPGRPLIRAQRL